MRASLARQVKFSIVQYNSFFLYILFNDIFSIVCCLFFKWQNEVKAQSDFAFFPVQEKVTKFGQAPF